MELRGYRPLRGTLLLVGSVAVSTLALIAPSAPSASATPVASTGSQISLVADGIREPEALRLAPDGRLFLLQQAGKVRIVKGGKLLKTPALQIDPSVIVEHNASAGLLSIAFPPGFNNAAVQYVYLLYTHEPMAGYPERHNVVSRWTISGNTIDPTSEQILVHLDPLTDVNGNFANSHYGGDMEFGSDGKLYVSTGDLYISSQGQSMDTLNGKILRYNPDGTIPNGNPYVGQLQGRLQAIWASGFRNPFKLTLNRNGDIVIGDVGSTQFEEVNVLPRGTKGLNFGWSTVEGYTNDSRFVSPIFAYPHSSPTGVSGCAVMGGDVYRPKTQAFPALTGQYLFGDFCQGWIRSVQLDTGALGDVVATGFHSPVDIAVMRNGSIWVAERQVADATPGALYRIDPLTTTDAPVINSQPRDVTTSIGSSTSFSVLAAGSPPLTYQWYRDGVQIPGATSSTYSLPSVSSPDSGSTFMVKVSNSVGFVDSRAATLIVGSNTAPTATINTPAVGDMFSAGDTLHLSGSGTDTEDGVLPGSALSWEVELHHNVHLHEYAGPQTGSTMDVLLSRTIEVDPDIFYRVRLTVTDSDGATAVATRDVLPHMTTFSTGAIPNGTPIQVDGISRPTPGTFDSVVGTTRTVTAGTATVGGTSWTFDSWDDGSTNANRVFDAPQTPASFFAFFRPTGGSVGTGTGLSATYYGSPDLTNPIVTRVDRVPYFSWPAAPAPGVPKDDFSVKWAGQLQAQFSGQTQFWASLHRDETLTVTVGNTTVIDAQSANGSVTGSVNLTAGQKYPIVITYSDGNGSAAVDLTYGPDLARRSVIAGSQLYPS
ncbi:MAG: PQQ-dependent sugar dehydrogenase [Actinomycetes bacterium]